MQKTTRVLALLLCVMLLCSCSNPDKPADSDPAALQREQLYKYLFDTVIPRDGLAELASDEWVHGSTRGGVSSNPEHLEDVGCNGILSAVVRDFDMDGNQDLVVFRLSYAMEKNIWKPILSSENLAHVVCMDIYSFNGKNIELSDSCSELAMLDGASWGYIQIALEQLEDGIYIRAFSKAEDFSTYGASPHTIFHVEDGKFVFDFISGIHYGQASMVEDPNDILHTTDMKPRNYNFGSFPSENLAILSGKDLTDNRFVYYGSFELTDWGESTMRYTGTDFTGLRIIQKQGVEAYPHDPLPQTSKKPEDTSIEQYAPVGEAFIQHIISETGCKITDQNCYRDKTDGSISFSWETDAYNDIYLTYDPATDAYTHITVETNEFGYPKQWGAIKDAILTHPNLGLDSSELAPFMGRCDMGKYTNGVEITGATVQILQITNTCMRIRYN